MRERLGLSHLLLGPASGAVRCGAVGWGGVEGAKFWLPNPGTLGKLLKRPEPQFSPWKMGMLVLASELREQLRAVYKASGSVPGT